MLRFYCYPKSTHFLKRMTCPKAEDNMHEEGGDKGNGGEGTVNQMAGEVLMDDSERKHLPIS